MIIAASHWTNVSVRHGVLKVSHEDRIMEWHCCEFEHLSAVDLYAILRARNTVLVVEDAHTHLDIDGKDAGALHVYATVRNGDAAEVAAYARLLPGDDIDPDVVIDKVLTSEACRDGDTLDHLLERALTAALAAWPDAALRMHVPAPRQAFYKRFGFRKAYGPYLEQGAPFVGMIRPADRTAGALRQLLSRTVSTTRPRNEDARADGRVHNRLPADTGANR
ncbi:GNAT family N-acetyltransferase [Burkholderia contaminans]|uniref:Drug:proton antiporter n=1 Tax=Burkholderia contaminans TaxID=488447 RepID=A0A3N8RFX7_9BURK|nr:drug:proton antiporter [Burkholderia contaminans]RQT05687.1 drug:proton antiporter [Burkholderia contaminans]RQT34798.1 drug:proton antiporter [Burkholderia contaminans]